jgi:hypothetical protein
MIHELLEIVASFWQLSPRNDLILSGPSSVARAQSPAKSKLPDQPRSSRVRISFGEEMPTTFYCSFCIKSQYEVAKLIAGPGLIMMLGRDRRGPGDLAPVGLGKVLLTSCVPGAASGRNMAGVTSRARGHA